MRILADTNVLLDVVTKREPFFDDSVKIFDLCEKKIIVGSIASISIVNMAYILRKDFPLKKLHEIFFDLCDIFYIESVDFKKLIAALANDDFNDFEDCLQFQCAKSFRADFIVTRNVKDFAASEIPAVTPEDFLKLLSPPRTA